MVESCMVLPVFHLQVAPKPLHSFSWASSSRSCRKHFSSIYIVQEFSIDIGSRKKHTQVWIHAWDLGNQCCDIVGENIGTPFHPRIPCKSTSPKSDQSDQSRLFSRNSPGLQHISFSPVLEFRTLQPCIISTVNRIFDYLSWILDNRFLWSLNHKQIFHDCFMAGNRWAWEHESSFVGSIVPSVLQHTTLL